jgi:hypothetical protein
MTTMTCTTVVCESHTSLLWIPTTRQALSTTGTVAGVGHVRNYVQPAQRRKSGNAANRHQRGSQTVYLQTTDQARSGIVQGQATADIDQASNEAVARVVACNCSSNQKGHCINIHINIYIYIYIRTEKEKETESFQLRLSYTGKWLRKGLIIIKM